ncbi:DUF488 domain-containing protein [Daejeonia sp. YH14]|uniref:DUF488 domain-containing protein n=1 Tax=Daejeonia sp. YH14 TaxID=3439042 RepID=UPI003F49752B
MEIALKRVYEKAVPEDGYRVLVDRIWPRGISKEAAALAEWDKDLAPSAMLRKWFHHDPELWEEFAEKYWKELQDNGLGRAFLERLKNQEKVTLVYAAKDRQHCHPIILKKYLESIE